MRITDIRFSPGNGKVIAHATVVFDEMFCVNGLSILRRDDGLTVLMPRHKHADGSYRDTAHPINRETRSYIESSVLAAFRSQAGPRGGSQVPGVSQAGPAAND